MNAIDALFAQYDRSDAPGAVVAVTRHGQEIHAGAYGMASIAHQVPLDRRSVIRIGSQTKQFTVLLALILEQAGKLSMDHEVHRYAPWLAPTPQPITLAHLARNTSGLRDFLEMLTWSGLGLAAPSTRQAARDLISRHAETNFAPGSAMIYCNTGFFLLSEIIEEVSGRSFNELLEGHLTARLGMADSTLVGRDDTILPRLADMHLRTGEWQTARWGLVLGGEGGMVSTADDMLKWQAMLAHPPSDLAPLLKRMEAPVAYTNGTMATYAMGLVRAPYRGQTTISHGGGVAGGKSESMRFLESGLGVVLLANLDDFAPHPLGRRIMDIVLEPEIGPRPPLEDLAAHAGLWRENDGDDLLALAAGPTLLTSGGPVSLDQPAPGVFTAERPTLDLRFSTPVGNTMQANFCGRPTSYRKLGPAPAASLAGLAGDYANPTLGLSAHLSPDGALAIRSDIGGARYQVTWADRDLLLLHAPAGPTPGRPFVATLRLVDGGMVLTTDRTRGLGLKRIR